MGLSIHGGYSIAGWFIERIPKTWMILGYPHDFMETYGNITIFLMGKSTIPMAMFKFANCERLPEGGRIIIWLGGGVFNLWRVAKSCTMLIHMIFPAKKQTNSGPRAEPQFDHPILREIADLWGHKFSDEIYCIYIYICISYCRLLIHIPLFYIIRITT